MQFSPALGRHDCRTPSSGTRLPGLRRAAALALNDLQAAPGATILRSLARAQWVGATGQRRAEPSILSWVAWGDGGGIWLELVV